MNAQPPNGVGIPQVPAQQPRRRRRRQKPKGKRIVIPPVKVNGEIHVPDGGAVMRQNVGVGNIPYYSPADQRNTHGFYFVKPAWSQVFSKISSQAGGLDLTSASVRLTSMQVEIKNLAPGSSSANIEVFKNLNAALNGFTCNSALANDIDSLRMSTIGPGKAEKFTISFAEKEFSTACTAGRVSALDSVRVGCNITDPVARYAKFKFENLDLANIANTVPACCVAIRINGGWAPLVANLPAGTIAIAEVKYLNLQFKIVSD